MRLVHNPVKGINFRKNTNQTSAGFGKNHGDKFLILRMNESKNHDSQPDERVASIGQRTVKGKND